MKIWVNCIIHNEENFVWFALKSIIDFVDKVIIFDTGSNDNTIRIIEEMQKLHGSKIIFREVGEVDGEEFTKMRQAMLDQSDCDWIIILDGDEIWWEDSIKKVVNEINTNGSNIEGIVVPFLVPLGDIYHLQKETAGQYKLLGRKGHLSLRAINRKIPGLHLGGTYGVEGFFDGNNVPIQERGGDKLQFIDAPFLHTTHLNRSSKDDHQKFKYETGVKVPANFSFPQVFYKDRPKIVRSPVIKRSRLYEVIAFFTAPYLNIRRRISNEQS